MHSDVSELPEDFNLVKIHSQPIEIRDQKLGAKAHDFNNLLLNAVDEALSSLGESLKTAIYFHLENTFHIKRQEIPKRIEVFTIALEDIFGLGAKLLEVQIMKNLHAKIGGKNERIEILAEPELLTFSNYVCLIKQKFEDASKNGKEIERVNARNQRATKRAKISQP
jgi:hypothetical protein